MNNDELMELLHTRLSLSVRTLWAEAQNDFEAPNLLPVFGTIFVRAVMELLTTEDSLMLRFKILQSVLDTDVEMLIRLMDAEQQKVRRLQSEKFNETVMSKEKH